MAGTGWLASSAIRIRRSPSRSWLGLVNGGLPPGAFAARVALGPDNAPDFCLRPAARVAISPVLLVLCSLVLPAPYPDDWARVSAAVLADEAHYLTEAELYVLTPQMMDVVVAAAQTLNLDYLALLAEDDLPSPAGVLVLPRPLVPRTMIDNRHFCRWGAWGSNPEPTD